MCQVDKGGAMHSTKTLIEEVFFKELECPRHEVLLTVFAEKISVILFAMKQHDVVQRYSESSFSVD
jgi:hypothetical protein